MKITGNKERFLSCAKMMIACGVFMSASVGAKESSQLKASSESNDPQPAKTFYINQQQPQELPESVNKLLKKYKIPTKNISVYVRDLNADAPMLELNANKLRTPASTMKLLTTYATLKELGPNYSWRTEVWTKGPISGGVLNGDLVLKGYGDPFLVYENFWKLVKTLRDKGLKQINGDIIIDNSFFQLDDYDPGAFDGKAFRIYNAESSALMFNFQATRFLFTPEVNEQASKQKKSKGKKNKSKTLGKVKITPYPEIPDFNVDNQIKLVKGRCRNSHLRPKFKRDKKGKLVISGNYAAKCKQRFILRAVSKPEEHVFNAFRDFWLDLNGTLKGGMKIGRVSANDELFHVHSSPTLGEQIRLINKWSNNVMTKQLLLTLGAKKYGSPGTLQKGRQAILDTLNANHIDTTGIQLENGSGLSRSALITARQMGSLLETAFRDPFMPEFMASLSLPGVDGTLVNRFRKDELRGRSHLKTGTLDFVTAISGYMLNRKGKRLVIAIQHNGKRTGAGRGAKIQDAILRWSFEQ
ncbi:D-alanyl-D-alanine carboxypeptidase/D-alanyl-D-alanine-endopeptidase [Cocleimonas sp. KMM 6892]|uniref:D-alanyl-D-alanine carboxypeptidase/D-alanyl-D-alanine endopeptidase n=1 Tax=unclassified Cocleimonas TaxID=2639732 RepID=UPI002DB9AB75|nr:MULTISPECIES: D-alanyl-D-alanine carboxypeptidase/D-alanyl-D-alanine-endopeptidase [unclassified Cocleimonas]MEB8432538.1 D-alanyl-D-alanine carboxypeptidase/D-alanyl-D-alanine-endopeptidase [Cocleimonas sp. KMM 6892]MEC4715397.1 D-alanyl-D-alanine carboxypeptidase/D-alanyl-D-alanine-endopeptidase [Cocleimonas sp. KMM 6895]MEC4744984.1 D-alanyl-D-alanine carboxypeptidase/D-alanyl-D-alanine-endopeptidase [Cocleimonas sp. KMM 6896]